MRHAVELIPAGHWPADAAIDVVTLDHQDRHRRRIRLRGAGGLDLLLDLPQTSVMRDGDGLRLADGGFVRVAAAPEPLLEITAESGALLLRLAWHIGNRHLPVAISADRLLIRDDHVIAEMIRGLGGRVRAVSEPFDPEGGAYKGHGNHPHATHGHGHGHDHGGGHHHHHD